VFDPAQKERKRKKGLFGFSRNEMEFPRNERPAQQVYKEQAKNEGV